jgi:beta-fructofuranosidase
VGDLPESGADTAAFATAAAQCAGREEAGRLRRRPVIHFTAPANWLNDPNGLICRDGRYHLFYQFNPHAPAWARPAWGHAVSRDLLTWADLPPALTPQVGIDAVGCYSGCCVDDDGTPTIVYTAVTQGPAGLVERVHVATGDNELITWHKEPVPVLTAPPELPLVAFRDPHVRRGPDGRWEMVIGAGLAGAGGAVLAYSSRDLRSWTPRGVLLDAPASAETVGADLEDLGAVWECPFLLRIGDHDVLVLSVWDGEPSHVLAVLGQVRGDRFEPASVTPLDLGPSFYAPHPLVHEDGRTEVFGWLREDAGGLRTATGWVGALSLPRELDVVDGRVVVRPAPALRGLRRQMLVDVRSGTDQDGEVRFGGAAGALEITAVVAPTRAGDRGEDELVAVRLQGDRGDECLLLQVGPAGVTLTAPAPSAGGLPLVETVRCPDVDGEREIVLYVDVTVAELFVAGAPPLTVRLPDGLSVEGGTVRMGSAGGAAPAVTAWQLGPPPAEGSHRSPAQDPR